MSDYIPYRRGWELGEPVAYRVLEPGLRNIPLNESTIWPDMTDWEAERYVGQVETGTSRRLGLAPCEVDEREFGHAEWFTVHPNLPCPDCKARL